VVAIAPDLSVAERVRTDGTLTAFTMNLPGHKTYVFRGTTDDGKSCGPVTQTVPMLDNRPGHQTTGPGLLTVVVECRS